MKTKIKTLICVILLLVSVAGFFAGYVTGILSVEKAITTGTNIVTDFNLSVFANDTTTEQLVHIAWGDMQPLSSKTVELWVQNDAQIPMTISLSTQDWLPSYAESAFTFSYAPPTNWAGSYPILQPTWRACVLLTLTASETVPSGAVAFTVVVHGSAG
jgi:hypothetical protein